MIQSPRGYPLLRDDPKTSLAEDPVTSSLWYDEVGNDIAWATDARGQVKAAWAAITSGNVRAAGDTEFGANAEGLTHAWRAETAGPFPLHRLSDGRPQPVRVVVDLKSSDGEVVFVRAVLRHAHHERTPWPSTGGVVDGWNHGFASTDGTSYAALPLEWENAVEEAASPLRGFLQFPPSLWHVDTPVNAGDLDRCVMACVDFYLGRMADTTTVTMGGYTVYAVDYGAREASG